MEIEKQYQKGKLYQYTGAEFVELEPSTETKLPVSDEAMGAVKQVRKAAQSLIKLRPELSLTVSAMLLAAAQLPNIAELVQKYGQQVYSERAAPATSDDKAV
jgi:hypothetical protein